MTIVQKKTRAHKHAVALCVARGAWCVRVRVGTRPVPYHEGWDPCAVHPRGTGME